MKKMLKVNMLRLLLGMSTLVFLGISGSFTAYAGDTPAAPQQHKRVVKGRVTDKKTGEPIVGATVWFKESTSGTATDAAGNYSLNRPQGNAILSVSFIGYKSQEVVLGKEDVINFQLEETSEMIEEAVVVGYGSQRKESVIGAITTVGVAELKQPTGQISNSLAGRLAGVVAVQRSGEPGQSSEFWIRGISTFGANKDPLILVDGVERSLDLLDPEDIESFSILKDATATAVYGVRGANGVIIVNTRRGKEGRPDINVKAQVGILTPTKVPKMANSATWAEMYNVARTSHDKAPLYTPEEIQKYKDHSDPYLYPDIDWLDALMKNHTTQQRVNLNVTGGGSIARYYISGAFFNENGLFISDPEHEWDSRINYKRYNFTSNVDVNLHPTTILKLNIGGSMETKHQPYNSISSIFNDAMNTSPNVMPLFYPDRDEDGAVRYAEYGESVPNPYNTLTQAGYNDNWWTKINAMIALEQDFSKLVTEGLKAEIKFSFDANSWNQILRGGSPHTWYARMRDDDNNLVYEEKSLGSNTLSYTSYANGERALYLEGRINYDRLFGKHRVGALFLYNQRNYQVAAGSSIDALPYRDQGLAGRVTYSYDDRYFIEGNFGYNGSENFASGNRFGFFPAGAIGWIVSNEKFMGGVTHIIDMLKLKGSYGIVGNDDIGGARRWVYESTILVGKDAGAGQWNYGSAGANGGEGIRVGDVENLSASWEEAAKMNVGVEFSLFNRLRVQADYFHEKRTGIFLQRAGLPAIVGLSVIPYTNIGETMNQGFDGTAEYSQKVGNVYLTGRANFTYNRNELLNNDEPDWEYKYQNRVGKPFGSGGNLQPFGLVALGLFESQEEIDNSPKQSFGEYRVGDIKYQDVNGDGQIDSQDQIAMGYTNLPEIVYGFGATAQWKNWDVNVFFQGVSHVNFYLSGSTIKSPFSEGNMERSAINEDVYDNVWRLGNTAEQNAGSIYPRLSWSGAAGSSNNSQTSDWWMRNGSFLRLKNFEVGYTMPKGLMNKTFIKSLRFYLSGNNLLTFSKFKLWDPEKGNGDGSGYPPNRVVTVGLNANF